VNMAALAQQHPTCWPLGWSNCGPEVWGHTMISCAENLA
jgi:hypothetical protein